MQYCIVAVCYGSLWLVEYVTCEDLHCRMYIRLQIHEDSHTATYTHTYMHAYVRAYRHACIGNRIFVGLWHAGLVTGIRFDYFVGRTGEPGKDPTASAAFVMAG